MRILHKYTGSASLGFGFDTKRIYFLNNLTIAKVSRQSTDKTRKESRHIPKEGSDEFNPLLVTLKRVILHITIIIEQRG